MRVVLLWTPPRRVQPKWSDPSNRLTPGVTALGVRDLLYQESFEGGLKVYLSRGFIVSFLCRGTVLARR